MWVQNLQEASGSLCDSVLVPTRHPDEPHFARHVYLEIPPPQPREYLGKIVRHEAVSVRIICPLHLRELPSWDVGMYAIQERGVLEF